MKLRFDPETATAALCQADKRLARVIERFRQTFFPAHTRQRFDRATAPRQFRHVFLAALGSCLALLAARPHP